MDEKELTTWREEAALERFQIIAPLLDSNLDRDKKVQLRKELALQNNLSVKTLRRYESAYLKGGRLCRSKAGREAWLLPAPEGL